MNIVYCLTRNLYDYLLPSIRSLMEHDGDRIQNIFLMIEDDTFPHELPDVCRIINVSGQQHFTRSGANAGTRFTYMAMMRVAYAKYLPEDIDKIIQLDVDTIMCDTLEPIWNIDLTGKWFAGAIEPGKTREKGKPYINAGVMVINLKAIRDEDMTDKFINILNTNRMQFIDQDLWNSFADKGVQFDSRYNETNFTGLSTNPAVVHYAGVGNWYKNKTMFRVEYLDKYR